jgi:serine/threonine protein kinase
VTPANVLVPPDDGPPKLKDSGLWDALAGSALLRHAIGKRTLAELPYLSPEHVDPDGQVDDLSDQYCLGAVVYALLTGRPPCEGGSPEETVRLIREAPPLRAKEACQGLPDGFQAVVLRMLAKRPEDRYGGPGPLLEDLDAVAAKHGEEG